MKDSQQMSVEISNQNDMALKALPPVGIKDNNIFPVDSVVDDLLDEDFHLHLSEDENEEKTEDGAAETTAKVPEESEDDILDKFDNEPVCNGNDDENVENDSQEPVKVNGECANSEESNDDSEKTKSDSVQNEKNEEEEKEKEKANADLLEDQIMDTEHLLQIVDKDQEDAEDTKDSCSSNSEMPDKGDDTEAEGEKNENAEEEEEEEEEMEAVVAEAEAASTDNKDDDNVDIEESSLYKEDFESEIDKEYENIANEKEETVEQPKTVEEDEVPTEEPEKEVPTEESEKEVNESPTDVETPEPISAMEVTGLEAEEESSSDSGAKTAKRPLSEVDSPTSSKKPKYSETDADESIDIPEETPEPTPEAPKIQALNVISEFMQKKTLKKLTREDLEQICLMKMCEAICHKSEIGELRHQLGVQEQMVDMWRKEAAQLTKQARDLEIVNKRLLHEVRLKNDRDKPLIPVKITRSVGLQVRSDNNVMNNVVPPQKRRFSRPQPTTPTPTPPPPPPPAPPKQQNRFTPTKPVTSNTTPSNNVKTTVINKVVAMPVNKPGSQQQQQQPVPKPKTLVPKSPSSLLSKALQPSASQTSTPNSTNSSHTNNSPATPSSNTAPTVPSPTVHKPNPPPKPKPIESKVIDLTDEDDKKPVTTASSTLPTTPQGVRIVSTPVKNAVVSSSAVVNPPRIMYVYNNQLHQGLIADSSKIGTQKLMLKLNSNVIGQTNGVIATVSNGSTLAVTTANLRTSQVQQVRLSTPVTTVRTTTATKPSVLKHPAPLPPPPITQMSIAARKPIPPKPHLSIRRSSGGIVLSWKMPYNLDNFEAIASYQLYAYQETTSAPSSDMWRKVGDVKALALPMACTLTQFADGNKYHFAVRAVDVQKRMGPFSDPEQILL